MGGANVCGHGMLQIARCSEPCRASFRAMHREGKPDAGVAEMAATGGRRGVANPPEFGDTLLHTEAGPSNGRPGLGTHTETTLSPSG